MSGGGAERERERERKRRKGKRDGTQAREGAERKRERERITSRLHTASADPDLGLEPRNQESDA